MPFYKKSTTLGISVTRRHRLSSEAKRKPR
jgi:hypothetical protein